MNGRIIKSKQERKFKRNDQKERKKKEHSVTTSLQTDLLVRGQSKQRCFDISWLNARDSHALIRQLWPHGLRQALHEELGPRVDCQSGKALWGMMNVGRFVKEYHLWLLLILHTIFAPGLSGLNFPQFPTRSDTSVEWVVSWLDGWLVAFDALPAISVS